MKRARKPTAAQVEIVAKAIFGRDSYNVETSDIGRANMRPDARKAIRAVNSTAYARAGNAKKRSRK